jgi:hypothetical protein
MAISGAFGAGFVQGFGESFKKDMDKRFDKQQQYVDNMMENARRVAPKYAQDTATANATLDLMNEFETRYGVSNTEFIALAQTHDINKVYESIQIAEQGLRDGQKLDVKGNILSALKIPEGAKLPDGMTAEDAVRSMVLGYAQNVSNKPEDSSEAHKNTSWAKAISDTLALNPRASAEEQIAAMQVAGVPVQELLQYQAAQGGTYSPLQNVARTGVIDFSDDYKASDYETIARSYTRTINSIMSGSEDLALANAETLDEAMKVVGVDNVQSLAEVTISAGRAVADLDLDLANNGIKEYNRIRMLQRLGEQINMGTEITALKEAVDSGLAMRLVQESYDKHGKLTQEYIDAILSNREVEQVEADKVTAAAPDTPAFLSDPTMPTLGGGTVGGPDVGDRPSMPVMPEDQVDAASAEPEEQSLIDTIKSNEASQESGILPSGMIAGNAATVAQQQEDYIARTREAASKITYSAYQRMLETPAGRAKLKEMGLPTQKFRTGKDRALAFGVMNPEQYFAPEPDAVTEEEPKSEAPMTRSEFQTSDDGMALLNYLMDEEGLTAEDSLEDIKDAVAAWFGDNPTVNVGAEVTAEDVAKSMKQTLTLLAQED